jgi:hypothetical protein
MTPISSATRGIIIFIIIACAGAAYFFLSSREPLQQQPVVSDQPPPSAPNNASTPDSGEPETLTRHPIPESGTADNEPEEPLPTLEDSDFAIQQSLGRITDSQRLDQLLIFNNFINRLVVTIDNLPRSKLPVQRLPNKPPLGKFLVKKQADGAVVIDPGNYQRYTSYVRFFEGLDSHGIAALYFHFYPLFQEAYTDLGYKSAYFNDRVIEAIDDLLATPEVKEPVKLIRPSVFYKYADPRLEGLSMGERLMIRIGGDNAARVKAKLRELRNVLTKAPPRTE